MTKGTTEAIKPCSLKHRCDPIDHTVHHRGCRAVHDHEDKTRGTIAVYSYHVHSTFSDGKGTPEQIVLTAIEKGFIAIGFSDHGYTEYDLRYCMTDQAGYITEIKRLKEAYKNQIQIYLGVEEDAFNPLNRNDFDYIIGSCHHSLRGNTYYPIDSDYDYFKRCLAAFDNDHLAFAESYYSTFCAYIKARKPHIIGHFDLITKFDQVGEALFLGNADYIRISERYTEEAMKSGCIFEVNTGAIARGLRTTVYPFENLLRILRKNNVPVILSSDSHSIDTLDFGFEDAKKYLKDIGFQKITALVDNSFKQFDI